MATAIHRPWIKLHARLLHDDDFLDLNPISRLVYIMSLLKAADTGGKIPHTAAKIARFAGISQKDAEEALQELTDMKFWVVNDAELSVRTFSIYQVPHDDYVRQTEKATERKRRQRFREQDISDSDEMRQVRQRFLAALESELSTAQSTEHEVAIYQAMHEEALERCSSGGEYQAIFETRPTALADATVRHAAQRWMAINNDDPQMRRIEYLRRRLGRAIFGQILFASFNATTNPVAYLERACKEL